MEEFRENSLEESGYFHPPQPYIFSTAYFHNQTDTKIQMDELCNGLENQSIDKVFRKPKVHGFNAKLHLYLKH